MNIRTGRSIGKQLLTMLLIGSMLLYGFQAVAPQASAAGGGDEDALTSIQVLADKNVVVACHNGAVENNGDPGKAGPLKSGSDHDTHRSYLSFTVPSVTGAVYSAQLRLTPLADKSNAKLGIYAGPAVEDWPTTTDGMWDAAAESDQAARAEHNCPSAPNTLVGQYTGTLTAGEAIEVDVGSLVDGPGTYTLMLRGLAGTSGDYAEFLSLYRDPGDIDNVDNKARPQLIMQYTGGDDDAASGTPPADCTIVVPVLNPDSSPNPGQVWGASPGAKICIEGGPRSTSLLLANLQGTADNPVEIVAYGGAVEATANLDWDAAMDIRNSKYFILNGLSQPGVNYGFKLTNNAAYGFGLQAGRGSTNYTIQGVEVAKAGFAGFMLRSDVSHGFKRASFTQQDVAVRHNKIAHIGGSEAGIGFGIFVGVANFGANADAHETKGLRIHDNLVSDTKRDGMAIYGASEDVRVYGNEIRDYAAAGDPANNSGILIGTGSSGYYYGNVIMGQDGAATGRGINNEGRGDVELFNNLIVTPGESGIASPAEAAFVIAGDPLFTEDLPTIIRYNTIVHPLASGSGILLRDTANRAEGNLVERNLIVHRSGSAADYVKREADAYPVAVADNYTTDEIAAVLFADAAARPDAGESYALAGGSPAEGHGFLPGITPPADERYDALAGWVAEDDGGGDDGEEPVDPLDPEFDYDHYVADPVDFDCDYVIPSNAERNWDGAAMGVEPGATVCVEQGLRPAGLRLVNFAGTANDPITFVNYGGVVTVVNGVLEQGAAIKISASSHVRLAGIGDNNAAYGFRFKAVGSGMMGVAVDSKSTNVEVDHVEVFGAGFAGIMMKTDPVSTDPTAWRENFTMTGLTVRDNYIHDVGGEGMYIGNTSYHNGVVSNGVVVWPHAITGLRVHDNRVERTGWDGIQVASVTEDVAVYNNRIEDYGLRNELWQDSGLQIGPGSTGAYYNNIILRGHGTGSGINSQGHGDMIFYNNLIVDAKGAGIISLDRLNAEQDEWYGQANPIYFVHNTIVNPGSDGINFHNKTDSYRGSAAHNNLIVMGGATGGAIRLEFPDESELAADHNYIVETVGEAGFADPAHNDYRLQSGSGAIDAGRNLSGFAWASAARSDLAGQQRPSGAGYDAGAYERQAIANPDDQGGSSGDDGQGGTSGDGNQGTPVNDEGRDGKLGTKDSSTDEPGSAAPQPTPQPVPADARQHWASDAIRQLADLGALITEEDGSFRPDMQSSRAAFVDMLVRALGLQAENPATFADAEEHWARQSIAIAAALKLVSGYDANTFGPDRAMTREEMAVIVARALKLDLSAGSLANASSFRDESAVSAWAQAAVRAAAELGLISGYPDGSFQPKRPLSRAEAAIVIMRVLAYLHQETRP